MWVPVRQRGASLLRAGRDRFADALGMGGDRVDELSMRGRSEMSRAVRGQLYAEVQTILADEIPVIPLWHEDNLALMNVDIAGYRVFPNARFAGLTVASKRSPAAD